MRKICGNCIYYEDRHCHYSGEANPTKARLAGCDKLKMVNDIWQCVECIYWQAGERQWEHPCINCHANDEFMSY